MSTAIVTGAANGIGRATAERLVADGFTVAGPRHRADRRARACTPSAATSPSSRASTASSSRSSASSARSRRSRTSPASPLSETLDELTVEGYRRQLADHARRPDLPRARRRACAWPRADAGASSTSPRCTRTQSEARRARLRRLEGGPRGGDARDGDRARAPRRARERRRAGLRAHPHVGQGRRERARQRVVRRTSTASTGSCRCAVRPSRPRSPRRSRTCCRRRTRTSRGRACGWTAGSRRRSRSRASRAPSAHPSTRRSPSAASSPIFLKARPMSGAASFARLFSSSSAS